MPHRCRNCENVIPDESESLLSGCPSCDHSSWEYVEEQPTPSDEDDSQQAARTEFIDSDSLPAPSAIEALQNPNPTGHDTPDTQSSENTSDVLSSANVQAVEDISEIQAKLNQQYEGIKVVRQGRYEINLTKLYRGHDHVIEIGDDGAYTVTRASDKRR